MDAVEPVRGKRGRGRRRPEKLHAAKAYDDGALRQELRRRGITPRIARRGIDSSARLGVPLQRLDLLRKSVSSKISAAEGVKDFV